MRASTMIHLRRRLGNWLAYALPDDHEEETRKPDPPPPKQMPLTGLDDRTGENAGSANCVQTNSSGPRLP